VKVGFIGLGAMGRHMAARLEAAGHALQTYDLNGKGNCKSAREAATGVEVVFTSLPGPAEVEWVSRNTDFSSVKAWFDTSTNSPEVVRRLNKSVPLLDAPVSGGPKGAESGKLAIWVGGDERLFNKYLPLLKALGDQPCYVGPIGAGTIAKLAHNMASFTIQAALAEIMTLGVKAGVEPVALFKAIRQGASGRKRTFDRLPEHFLPGKYDPPAFTVDLALKDVTLAMDLARSNGVPMKIGQVALDELAAAKARGWGQRDSRVAMTLQEERAGVSVKVPPERLQGILD
jgi:3-hydroxyisobutyrate dehydrogenase